MVRIARLAFALTIVFLALGLFFGLLALHRANLWAPADPSNETLAKLAAMSLFATMACNAAAFTASLWGWWQRTSRSVLILVVSGVGILASIACGVSLIP